LLNIKEETKVFIYQDISFVKKSTFFFLLESDIRLLKSKSVSNII